MLTLEFINDDIWRALDKTTRKDLPIAVKIALGNYMNLVRRESVRWIIPDRTGMPDFEDSTYGYAKRLYQRTHPTRLTSRSGRLLAGLLEGNDAPFINLNRRVSTTDPNVYKTLNGKITGGGRSSTGSVENFVATWNPYIRDGSAMLKNKANMRSGDKEYSTGFAKKLARIRFQHEKGIRGHIRMFMWPSHLANRDKLNGMLLSSLKKHYISLLQ